MTVLRSLLFNLAFYLWTLGMMLAFLPALLLPRAVTIRGMEIWSAGVMWLLRALVGLRAEIRGREHLPAGACIVAAKHQSAWDTVVFHLLLRDPAIVLKRELMWIPLYGQFAAKARMIAVDRGAAARALRRMVEAARRVAGAGRPIVIFPQGTRVAPGVRKPYLPGVVALYRALHLPVVPVALNSGLFWPRRSLLRQAGTVTLEFLEPIPPGLPRDAFSRALEERIEGATVRLIQEAGKT